MVMLLMMMQRRKFKIELQFLREIDPPLISSSHDHSCRDDGDDGDEDDGDDGDDDGDQRKSPSCCSFSYQSGVSTERDNCLLSTLQTSAILPASDLVIIIIINNLKSIKKRCLIIVGILR